MSMIVRRTSYLLLMAATCAIADERQRERTSARVSPAEIRALRDAALLPLTEFQKGWSVVEISPAENSGGAFAVATVDALGNVRLGEEGILYTGQWKVLATSPGESGATGAYRWVEAAQSPRQRRPDMLRFVPFTSGGTVLCRFDPDAKESAQFADVYLVPAGKAWAEAAGEVLAHPELAREIASEIREGRVANVVQQRNPLLASFAVRELLAARQVAQAAKDTATETIWSSNSRARPIVTFLLARSSPVTLVDLVENANGPEELTPVVRGLLTAHWFAAYEHEGDVRQLRELLRSVKERAIRIGAAELAREIDATVDVSRD